MKTLKKEILFLLEMSIELGLPHQDVQNAKELLSTNELMLSFDTLITQVYEYELTVNSDFCEACIRVIEALNLRIKDYIFLFELLP